MKTKLADISFRAKSPSKTKRSLPPDIANTIFKDFVRFKGGKSRKHRKKTRTMKKTRKTKNES